MMTSEDCSERKILDILDRFGEDSKAFGLHRQDNPDLVTQAAKEAKVLSKYLHLIFNRQDQRQFTPGELRLLLGKNWLAIKTKHEAADEKQGSRAKRVLDRNGFRYDLSRVSWEDRFSTQFDILDIGCGVLVPADTGGDVNIHPMVNLAMALSLTACRQGRGVFLWQPKSAQNAPAWHQVPDLVYWDQIWREEDREKFVNASYREQKEYLCAALRLRKTVAVLPFVVDYTGDLYEETEEEVSARVTADLDGIHPPKAAISIPYCGYVGWYSDFVPTTEDQGESYLLFRPKTKNRGAQWCLPKDQAEIVKTKSLSTMVERIIDMYERPEDNSLVFYGDVLQLWSVAMATVSQN